MKGHEKPAFFNIFCDLCQRGYLAADGGYFDFVTVCNSEFAGIIDVYFYVAGG